MWCIHEIMGVSRLIKQAFHAEQRQIALQSVIDKLPFQPGRRAREMGEQKYLDSSFVLMLLRQTKVSNSLPTCLKRALSISKLLTPRMLLSKCSRGIREIFLSCCKLF